MFNNLGLSGGTGLPGIRIPLIRSAPIRRLPIRRAVPVCSGTSLGGSGNDIIVINNSSGNLLPLTPVPVTIVTQTPYTALSTDYMLAVDVAAAAVIQLPVSPTGTVFIIKDIDGDASVNNITVSGIGSTIDGSASALINVDYGSITLIFNGTEWNIV